MRGAVFDLDPRALVPLLCLTAACDCGGKGTAADADVGPGAEDAHAGDQGTGEAALPLPEFPGLTREVEIRTDTRGVPHIYGETDADVLFASGYRMATDRLVQMDVMRRRALGRQAEIFGEARLEEDQLMRLLGIARWAREDLRVLQRDAPDIVALLVAWVAGVNRCIDEVLRGDAPLPHGYGPNELDTLPEPWTAADALAIGKLVVFGNSSALETELLVSVLRRLKPELLDQLELPRPMYAAFAVPASERPSPLSATETQGDSAGGEGTTYSVTEVLAALARLRRIMSPFDDISGSNNWAVSGEHTANGRPIIAGDPHQSLRAPSVFYAQHLSSAQASGTLDTVGFSFIGAPSVHLGHNRKVVWTATNSFPDTMDLFELAWAGPDAVQIGGEELPVAWREEAIAVRDAAGDGTLLDTAATQVFRVGEVPGRGVLLGELLIPSGLVTEHGGPLLFQWTGMTGTADARVFFDINKSDSVPAFEAALSKSRCLAFNFVAADAANISYMVQVDVPDRGDPSTLVVPTHVLDGRDAANLWTGTMLPPTELPRSRNPAQGWLATANNDPFGFTGDGHLENDPFYFGAFFAPGFRAKRIEDELGRLVAAGGITVDDMQALQLDVESPLAGELLPFLEGALSRLPTDPGLASFRDQPALDRVGLLLTSEWDRQMTRTSSGALAFHAFLMFLTRRVLDDDLDYLFADVLDEGGVFVLKIPVLALRGAYAASAAILDGNPDVLVLGALSETATWLTERFGGVDPARYTWGDVHGTRFRGPAPGRFDLGLVPTRGGEDTVNPSNSRFFANDGSVRTAFQSGTGPVYRMVASFDDDGTPRALANWPPGNSGDPDSSHYADTLSDWVEGVYSLLPFRRADVEAETESVQTLTP